MFFVTCDRSLTECTAPVPAIGICQIWHIRLENWPDPDLAGFSKNGRIPDLLEPERKSGTTLLLLEYIP